MSYLTAAVVLVMVVCAVNLLLAVALARRARQYGDLIASRLPFGSQGPYRLPPGSRIRGFSATARDGAAVSLDGWSGNRVIAGFFSARCAPCHAQLPAFAELAKATPEDEWRVLAVVSGVPDETAEFATALDGAASVVIEEPRGPVATAFSVHGLPAFFLLDPDGKVESSAATVAKLMPGPARADRAARWWM
jgi:peroxiredoxin